MLTNKLNDILNNTPANDIYHIICKYIKDHVLEIPYMSIDEVANGCYVSKSMITKFVKKLGYNSFKEFKQDCEVRLCSIKNDRPFIEIKNEENVNRIKIFSDYLINSFDTAMEQLDDKKVLNLVKDIENCSQIVALGHGMSKMMCEMLQYYLDYLKIPVLVSDSDFNCESQMDKNTLIIVISAKGYLFKYDKRLIYKINQLKQTKWLITCNQDIVDFENILSAYSAQSSVNEFLILYMIKIIVNELSRRMR